MVLALGLNCMQKKVIEFNLNQRDKKMPDLRTGDVIRVHRKIIEGGKERIQIFEGIIIGVKGGQSSSPMITVRKVSQGIGVELIIPVFSPKVGKIELVKRAKIRRSKLYYIRERSAKSLRMKYEELSQFAKTKESIEAPAVEEVKAEAPKEETPKKEEIEKAE
jgi:large subunit ribosomal protein L19